MLKPVDDDERAIRSPPQLKTGGGGTVESCSRTILSREILAAVSLLSARRMLSQTLFAFTSFPALLADVD